ncbi:MAG: NAD(P)/FAD-dependent oxidoreductase [Candidatus Schekmanbacteria bacterium]|nr:NAD(P)/FAD-dependent oxidoreductase [Candidatus Schekmanbacteria bacterium]
MARQAQFDVAIIGGGHNGLICGGYLARAGLDVVIFERRLEAGGGLSTEEATLPGFYHNFHSVFHDAVEHMPAMKDLELEKHGARYVLPEVQVGITLSDGRCVLMHGELGRTLASLRRIDSRDATAWQQMVDDYGEFMQTLVVPALYTAPAAPSEQTMVFEESSEGLDYLRLSRCSPIDVVRETFASEAARALVLFQLAVPRGIVPDYHGLGMLVPLVVSQVERSHLAVGGSHVLAHALWRSFLTAGGKMRGCSEVRRILIEKGKAIGVELETGERVLARKAVISAVDLEQTFFRFVGRPALDPAFARRVERYRLDEFSLFGVHLALREAPKYRAAAHDPDIDRAFKVAIGFESVADFQDCWRQIRDGLAPHPPRLYACTPTVFDPLQAPEHCHTAFCWAPAPYALGEGGAERWDEIAETYADRCLEAWRQAAPNLTPDNILARRILSPLDIFRKLKSMPGGGVFHGRTSLDQIERFRPLAELAYARTPIAGLYLGGASLHPGGGILGACGFIAAGTVAEDLGVKKWWE